MASYNVTNNTFTIFYYRSAHQWWATTHRAGLALAHAVIHRNALVNAAQALYEAGWQLTQAQHVYVVTMHQRVVGKRKRKSANMHTQKAFKLVLCALVIHAGILKDNRQNSVEWNTSLGARLRMDKRGFFTNPVKCPPSQSTAKCLSPL